MAHQLQSISHVALHLRFDWQIVTVLSVLDELLLFEGYGHLILYGVCGRPSLYILTMQRDRKLVRDVTVQPRSSFLPISDHNIVTAHAKLLGRFARNRPARRAKRQSSIDRRWLTNDPHLRQEVSTVIGDHIRAFPPSGSSVDDV